MERQDELQASARLIGQALSGTVGVVGDVHRAIGRRVAGLLPAVASPVATAHETIAGAAYSAVSAALQVASTAGAESLVVSRDPDAPPASQTRLGSLALSAANGLWGDTLADKHPALALPMTVRANGRDVPLDRASVAATFPEATSRLAVFLHGLAESDASWWRGTAGDAEAPGSYGDRVRRDRGFSPVYVRYNSGLRVSDNGRALSRLLGDLIAAWPVSNCDMTLIGHSMGRLVARSACHEATQHGGSWVAAVRTVVTLGTPHLGAPLEKAVHVMEWLLSRVPETAPLARPLQVRSAGDQGPALRQRARGGLARARPRRTPQRSLHRGAVAPSPEIPTTPPGGCSATASCATPAPPARAARGTSRSRSATAFISAASGTCHC